MYQYLTETMYRKTKPQQRVWQMHKFKHTLNTRSEDLPHVNKRNQVAILQPGKEAWKSILAVSSSCKINISLISELRSACYTVSQPCGVSRGTQTTFHTRIKMLLQGSTYKILLLKSHCTFLNYSSWLIPSLSMFISVHYRQNSPTLSKGTLC